MNDEIKVLINSLENAIDNDDFLLIAYEITDKLEKIENSNDAIEPILKIFENNPDIDFGAPGPLVHFVEKFYKNGYEEKLIESIGRYPTEHTLFMLNRIINGTEGELQLYYINILQNVIKLPNLDEAVLECAKEFLSLHIDEKV